MKISWAQPSLSRDFALLSGAILFILLLLTIWVTYTTYTRHTETIIYDLEKEAVRIEYSLNEEIERTGYLLSSLGRQITLENTKDLVRIAQLLKAFDNKTGIYPILTWIGPEKYVLVSSNRGVLDKPLDISDRDYVRDNAAEPWKPHIGQAIQGRLSDRWVVPVSLGISDNTGRFLGSIMLSLDINTMSHQITQLVRREGISFAIISKSMVPLTEVSPDKDFIKKTFPPEKLSEADFARAPNGLVSQGSLFWGTGSYAYYHVSQDYPYVVLLGYDAKFSDEQVRRVLWSRLIEIAGIALFLFALLWIVRVRVVRPVLDMTDTLARVANGHIGVSVPDAGAVEINNLGREIERIGHYIVENKRIESELRHKTAVLRQSMQQYDIRMRGKTEYLAYLCQQLLAPLTQIMAAAQALKDQLYGPLENRKYRQYASDIHDSGNRMLADLQALQTIGKLESNYIAMVEKPLRLIDAMHQAERFLAERLQASSLRVKISAPDNLPRLVADRFRLQQIFTNLLLHMCKLVPAGSELHFSARTSSDNREKAFLILRLSTTAPADLSPDDLAMLAQRLGAGLAPGNVAAGEPIDIELEFARALADLHGGVFEVRTDAGFAEITLLLPGVRLDYAKHDE